MDECKNCIHYMACMHLIDTSKEELTVCECFESKRNIKELKSENSNLTSDLSSLRTEIERLRRENKILSVNADNAFQDGLNEAQSLYAEQIKNEIRAEAVKEFAERLKAEKFTHRNFGELVYVEDIDNLVKEFTEGEPK